jgi:alkylhydroperoxidase family enzyme
MSAETFGLLLETLTSGAFHVSDTGHPDLPLSAADRALLVYAAKLTLTPGAMTQADVSLLKEAGFDDRAIHDACTIVGYFAFVNRVADGLGVELES